MSRRGTGKAASRKRKQKGRGRTLWDRWRQWRTTKRSHHLTARVLNTTCVLMMAALVILLVLTNTWQGHRLADSGDQVDAWSEEVETRWSTLMIQAELHFEKLDTFSAGTYWYGPNGTDTYYLPAPSYHPGLAYYVEDAGTGRLVADGELKGYGELREEVDLPDDGTYVVTFEPLKETEATYQVVVVEAFLTPDELVSLWMSYILALFLASLVTFWYVLLWYRKFPEQYRRTRWALLAYVVVGALFGVSPFPFMGSFV